jgi:hypothetical protein
MKDHNHSQATEEKGMSKMTLEPDNDDYQESGRFAHNKKRRARALKRTHKRELAGLEHKTAIGIELTQTESARLSLLKDVYK